MSTRVDVEEIEVTRGEYVLVFVLGVFLLVVGVLTTLLHQLGRPLGEGKR